jgi:hypothetical protein
VLVEERQHLNWSVAAILDKNRKKFRVPSACFPLTPSGNRRTVSSSHRYGSVA